MSKGAFTIPEWCKDNCISRAMFYKLAIEGLAPRTMKIGRKRLVSVEAALEWRIQMEKNTQAMEINHGSNTMKPNKKTHPLPETATEKSI